MYVNLDCIALRTVKHSDRHSILGAYTRQRGRISMVIPAGNGRDGMRRRAMLMPGSRFSCMADIRDVGSHLPPMRDLAWRGVSPGGDGDPVKAPVALFLVDFLNVFLRDMQPDGLLFDFIDSMLERLAGAGREEAANFHILFLTRLLHFLGIEPDAATYRRGYVFDMLDGIFRPAPPLHGRYLDSAWSGAAALILRMTPGNYGRYRFSAAERNEAVDRLIEYYSIHFGTPLNLKSLDVVRAIFH